MARVSNQQVLTRGSRAYTKKKSAPRVDSVTYDPDARKEFLTGFHKRKLQRQAEGRKRAEDRQKQALRAERRRIREEKTKSIEQSMMRLREAEDIIAGRSEGTFAGNEEKPESEDQETSGRTAGSDDDEEVFHGFSDSGGILKKKVATQEHGEGEESTTVTVEEMQLDPYVDMSRAQAVLKSSTERAHAYAKYVQSLHHGMPQHNDPEEAEDDEESFTPVPKQRRKKFRYLPKQERKAVNKLQRRRH